MGTSRNLVRLYVKELRKVDLCHEFKVKEIMNLRSAYKGTENIYDCKCPVVSVTTTKEIPPDQQLVIKSYYGQCS